MDRRVRLNRAFSLAWPYRRGRGIVRRLLALPETVRVPAEADGTLVATRFGPRFRVRADGMHGTIYAWGHYEPHVTGVLIDLVRSGETVCDVGANAGWYTVVLAWHGAEVHAFEPLARHVDLVRENVAVNGLGERVRINRTALGSAPGTLTIHTFDGLPGGQASATRMGRADARPHACPVTTLDVYVAGAGVGEVALIKCDVEGHEVEVIRGGRRLLGGPRAPLFVFEVSPGCLEDRGLTGTDVQEALESVGYTDFYALREEGVSRIPDRVGDEFGEVLAAKPGHRDRLADRFP